jgi:hypothetical protein
MQLEVHIANAHVEVLCTSKCQTGAVVHTFHHEVILHVDGSIELIEEVDMNGYNLWAIVKHARFNACAINEDVDLSEQEVIFSSAWGWDSKNCNGSCRGGTFFEGCGLNTTCVQPLNEVLADWCASCENVSWGGLTQFTFKEPGLKLIVELLVFCTGLVAVLGGVWSSGWRCNGRGRGVVLVQM